LWKGGLPNGLKKKKTHKSLATEIIKDRIQSLNKKLNEQGIRIDPEKCEIIVAGSGFAGQGRYTGNNEYLNRRFIIHIIPKVGVIKN